ncbi:Uncharacterized protein DAT39_020723 [Clarias magur]|uniref:Uncharacterized protein n=1 Tax=Clarias magur TaxID=1594786 RepID=A0A8J4T5C5_CLAMG|nr:Uncharacterized protein DAT39_020723 [Clarias magur]
MQGKAEQHSIAHMIDTYSQPTPAVPEGGTTSSTAPTSVVSQQEQSTIKCICTGRIVNKMPPYSKRAVSNPGHNAESTAITHQLLFHISKAQNSREKTEVDSQES